LASLRRAMEAALTSAHTPVPVPTLCSSLLQVYTPGPWTDPSSSPHRGGSVQPARASPTLLLCSNRPEGTWGLEGWGGGKQAHSPKLLATTSPCSLAPQRPPPGWPSVSGHCLLCHSLHCSSADPWFTGSERQAPHPGPHSPRTEEITTQALKKPRWP
jgi:hypothetical protein